MTAEPITINDRSKEDPHRRITAAERRRRICEGGPPTPWDAAREDSAYYDNFYDQELYES